MFSYRFSIAAVLLELTSSFELTWQERMVSFLTSQTGTPAFRYSVQLSSGTEKGNAVLSAQSELFSVYQKDNVGIRVFPWHCGETDTEILLHGPDPGNAYHLYIPKLLWENSIQYSADFLLQYIGLEEILIQKSAMLVHASFIRYKGAGILFSAPSGTGKSTQASLWESSRGAEIINGDRTVLRKQNGGFIAYGSPYAGSSRIWKNESAPLKAIILLSQGPENVIRPAQNREAIRRLFPEILVNSWNPDFMDKVMSLLDSLIRAVPIYCLTCRPDEGAVELVERTLFG